MSSINNRKMELSWLIKEKKMSKKRLLVSNDDGIQSFFLRTLVEALLPQFEVIVAAPMKEQSWISKAFTRLDSIEIQNESEHWPCEAWSIDGKPADCVNIAIHHLCQKPVDAVISGINLGYNITLPLLLSSGTIAAASEGALQGLPAIALSLEIIGDFDQVRLAHGKRDEKGNQYTQIAAQRATALITELLDQSFPKFSICSINFPAHVNESMPVVDSQLALCGMSSLFQRVDHKHFRFHFPKNWDERLSEEISQGEQAEQTDFMVVRSERISRAMIHWGKLGNA